MKQTRPQLLWKFQQYLDHLKIHEEERRDRLSNMFLNRELSRETERDFSNWLGITYRNRVQIARTRGSRLMYFSAWLTCYRPFAGREERERLIRLYHNKQLTRTIEREFHQYLKAQSAKSIEKEPEPRWFAARVPVNGN